MRNEFQKKLINTLIEKTGTQLSENDIMFISRIFDRPLADYQSRIKQIGFSDNAKVLDVGSGFGQWAWALSEENLSVVALESDTVRLNFIENLSAQLNNRKITSVQAYLPELPFEDNSFDALFCYSVILVTPWRESLKEMCRILRPGGKIYLNANGFGWYKKLWFTRHNENKDYDPRRVAAEALMNTQLYRLGCKVDFPTQLLIEPKEMIEELQTVGFSNIQCGPEGTLCDQQKPQTDKKMSFLPGEFEGDTAVYEILANKK